MRLSPFPVALALMLSPAVALADWHCASSALFQKGQTVRTQDTLHQAEVDACRMQAGKPVYRVYAFGAGSREVPEDRLQAVEAFRLQETLAHPGGTASPVASSH